MRPDDTTPNRNNVPQAPSRAQSYSTSNRPSLVQQAQQNAAADLVRDQLDTLYHQDENNLTEEPTTHTETQAASPAATPATQSSNSTMSNTSDVPDVNPYDRTHEPSTDIQADQWKQYHSAWQDYYQKYYEGYYTHHVNQAQQAIAAQQQPQRTTQPDVSTPTPQEGDESFSRDSALRELRDNLREKVVTSAKKVRRSRHFMPIAAALGVVLIFGFIQYNQVIVSNVKAYVTPGSIDPQNIIVDPTADIPVGPESRLIIPKINVDTPVFYDIPTDINSQNKAMENGVAHFPIPGANSHPGEIGNTVLSGHSSNDVFAAGDYKYIFMQLDKLEVGDTIYANYNGTRYTYSVTKKEVVNPDQVNKLVYETDKPMLTLITCTPLGTALQRLLVTAEQVYPTTANAKPAEAAAGEGEASIPGQGQPTFIERLFGG